MNLRLQLDTTNINWDLVVHILQSAGMAYHTPEVHERAFNRSYTVVFVFDDENLVGFGRALSDGEYQAAIYDVAVLPDYQGKGIGKMILQTILEHTPNCNVILYAAPGKEKFYEKENFRRMKTGMALFVNGESMKTKGFTE
ncbi:GNAT family N-acetyltransferase [Paludibacter sp.]|uniref:GNAT family N-acetyltransferase n=1 Tax=Paludibacter sp. TaxID=1898105 RepID=UPI001354A681|nr:GNAT family N-acetyltransferase [Paludibacter sp.]MTK53868.1 GNAT family N-acetyltransferase [Paludibacter sp.]